MSGCSGSDESVQRELDPAAAELIGKLEDKVPGLSAQQDSNIIECNSFTITTWDVMEFIQNRYAARISQLESLQPQQISGVIRDTARDMSIKRLIYAAAVEDGYSVKEAQIDSAVEHIKKEFGGEEQFRKFIDESGYTDDSFRSDTRERLIGEAYLTENVFDLVDVSDEEVRAVYDEVKTATVRHILLSTEGKSDEEKAQTREKMSAILAEARAGADFAELAKKHTDDPGSKEKGGLYEDFTRGTMVQPFEQAAFNVPVGEISDIVETRYGFHIIKVINRKSETRPFEEVREQIENQLVNQKRSVIYQSMMKDLMAQEDYKEVWL
jgi:parvulin-like peptidyl-prolyl isomerase